MVAAVHRYRRMLQLIPNRRIDTTALRRIMRDVEAPYFLRYLRAHHR